VRAFDLEAQPTLAFGLAEVDVEGALVRREHAGQRKRAHRLPQERQHRAACSAHEESSFLASSGSERALDDVKLARRREKVARLQLLEVRLLQGQPDSVRKGC